MSGDLASAIIVIGVSNGNLGALVEVLAGLPELSVPVVVAIHGAEERDRARIFEAVAGASALPAAWIVEREHPAPGCVYLLPPGRGGRFDHACGLHLLEDDAHLLDRLFSSAGEAFGSAAIGLLLPGAEREGMAGLARLRQAGGIALADEASLTALLLGREVVDLALPAEQVPAELRRLSGTLARSDLDLESWEADEAGLRARTLTLVRAVNGIDFSQYKQSTLLRRLKRRVALSRSPSPAEYVRILEDDPDEARALAQDFLINVTSFFRDPEVYEALTRLVLPDLARGKSPEDPIRIWVPGCATGEEAYSLAILVLEFLGERAAHVPIQIFGTDLSEEAIAVARSGIYSEDIARTVSAGRLKRFFVRVERGYQISKSIRESCVFARQNLVADPPLAKMDLVSCRNLLIYFGPLLQQRAIPLLHYALKSTGGFLLLGKSEGADVYGDLFTCLDKGHKIYAKRPGAARVPPEVTAGIAKPPREPVKAPTPALAAHEQELDLRREVDRLIVSSFSPPAVVVDEHLEVVEFRGDTSLFIAPSGGRASLSLIKIVHPDLVNEVRKALEEARDSGAQVRRRMVPLRSDDELVHVDFRVIPLPPGRGQPRHFFVVFQRVGRAQLSDQGATAAANSEEVARLYDELQATRQYLQNVIDEREASTEELQCANEEVISANEELQTINQELETSKEELESANEELRTMNDELRARVEDLRRSEERFRILVSGVKDYAIFMLDAKGVIQSWNEGAKRIKGYEAAEIVGRHFSAFYPPEDIRARKPDWELEVAAKNGVYAEEGVRLRKDGTRFIANVTITALYDQGGQLYGFAKVTRDVSAQRAADERLRESEERFRVLVSQVRDYAIFMLSPEGVILSWNEGAQRINGYKAEEVIGRSFEIFYTDEDLAKQKPKHELELAAATGSYEEEGVRRRSDGTLYFANVLITALFDPSGKLRGFAKVTRDVTERKRVEEEVRRLNQSLEVKVRERTEALERQTTELSRSNEELERFAYVSSHDLKEPLRTVINYAQLLEMRYRDSLDPNAQKYVDFISKGAQRMYELITDLLLYSQVGKAELAISTFPAEAAVSEALQSLEVAAKESQASVDVAALPAVTADRRQVQQLFQNLLSNAMKFRGDNPAKIRIRGEVQDGACVFHVEDEGIGMAPEYHAKAFDLFQRLVSREKYAGTGIGLAICKRIVERHGGRIWIESAPGQGATVSFTLPRREHG